MPETIFAIRVSGQEQAIADVTRVGETFRGTGKIAADAFDGVPPRSIRLLDSIQILGAQTQSLARDVDSLGGKFAAEMLRAANDVAGVAFAIGTGGLGAVLAVTSIAVGRLAEAFDLSGEKAKKAADEAKKAQDAERQEIERTVQALIHKNDVLTDAALKEMHVRIEIEKTGVTNLLVEAERLRHTQAANSRERIEMDKREAAMRAEAASRAVGIQLMEENEAAQKAVLLRRQANEAMAAADKEEAERRAKAAEEEVRLNGATAARVMELNARIRRETKAPTVLPTREEEEARSLLITRAKLIDIEEEFRQVTNESVIAQEEKNAADEKAIANTRELQSAVADLTDTGKTHREEMIEELRVTLALSAAMNTYSTAVDGTNMIVSAFIPKVERLGAINRENWRDMLAITEDTKASYAAQVQAGLFALAQEAARKALFENGEFIRESALSLGAAATGNGVSAALHAGSAASHYAAAIAYGAMSTGAAVGFAGIGFSRGEGGLVGLTKEERERDQEKEKKSRSSGRTSGGGGGVTGGRIGGASGGGGTTVVNIYESGSVNAVNDDHLARTHARGSRLARKDGFARRAARY